MLFLILCSRFVMAQNNNVSGKEFDENPKIHLGVKAGFSLSNLQSTELNNKSARPAMVVGLYGNYILNKKVTFQLEMNGILKGANFHFSQASSLQRLSLFYLDLPILLNYSTKKTSKIIPFSGILPSIILRKDAYKTQEAVPQPVDLDLKKYDFAFSAGVLFKINTSVGLQLQVNYGIININNRLEIPFYPLLGNGNAMYNRNLQLSLVF